MYIYIYIYIYIYTHTHTYIYRTGYYIETKRDSPFFSNRVAIATHFGDMIRN